MTSCTSITPFVPSHSSTSTNTDPPPSTHHNKGAQSPTKAYTPPAAPAYAPAVQSAPAQRPSGRHQEEPAERACWHRYYNCDHEPPAYPNPTNIPHARPQQPAGGNAPTVATMRTACRACLPSVPLWPTRNGHPSRNLHGRFLHGEENMGKRGHSESISKIFHCRDLETLFLSSPH